MRPSTHEERRKTVAVFTHGDESGTYVLQMWDGTYTPEAAHQMIADELGAGRVQIFAVLRGLSRQDAATIVLIDSEVDTLQVSSSSELQDLLTFSIPSSPAPQQVRQVLHDDVTGSGSMFRAFIEAKGCADTNQQIAQILRLYVGLGDDPSNFTQAAEHYADELTPNERSILLMIFHVLMRDALPVARKKVDNIHRRENFPNN